MSHPPGEETAKAALEYFFQQKPSDEEIQACVAFLRADIPNESQAPEDHTSIHELTQRIALAKKAQAVLATNATNPAANRPPLELNLAHLSYFLYADSQHLKGIIRKPVELDMSLRCVEPFLKMMLQKMTDKALNIPFPIRVPDPGDDAKDTSFQPRAKTDEHGNLKMERDPDEAEEARRRDERCIATGCPEMEACHLLPFSLNNRPVRLSNARHVLPYITGSMMSETELEIIDTLVIPENGELATSDRSCNILCLNPLAHQIYDKAYFAFEWVGLSEKRELDDGPYKTVRLRWHWLPNCVADAMGQTHLHERTARKGDTGRLLKFGNGSDHGMATAIHRHLAKTSKISSHGVSLSRTENHRPLVTGNILLIRVKEEDLDKTRLLLQIQWLALRMAAISGAAEVVDDLDSEPPGSLDELPTSSRAMLQAETDELYDVVLPERRQMFAAQRAPESPDTEEAGPAPKADTEAQSMDARIPTLRGDPPRDDAKGLEDP